MCFCPKWQIICRSSGSSFPRSGARLVFSCRVTLPTFKARKMSGTSVRFCPSCSCWVQSRQLHWEFSPQSEDRRS
ncbi:hypothetical protein CPLU01_16019 [Colletotrichum plurivorum]|uniref:Uncharacterized protein n=1 Tax=Colletotrichum plurivorum TaxID=2175906 RepID=A0A8H6J204_9PEZI|nr:hypothetical protein CPLU01_16019 [Colletotrichum plurivorum]